MRSKKKYHPLHVATADMDGVSLPETLAAFIPAWTAREYARQFLRAHPRDRTPWKTLRSACANLQKLVASGLHAFFEAYLARTERLLTNNNQRGFYKHLKSAVGLEVTKARSEQFIRDEDVTLLREMVRIRERWAGFCHKLLIAKSLKLDPTLIDLSPPRTPTLSLEDEASMDEMTEALQGMSNCESCGARWSPGRTPENRPPGIRSVLS